MEVLFSISHVLKGFYLILEILLFEGINDLRGQVFNKEITNKNQYGDDEKEQHIGTPNL